LCHEGCSIQLGGASQDTGSVVHVVHTVRI
jgi:hypothetical protein